MTNRRQVTHHRQKQTTEVLAAGLGWFSIGLGLYELLASRHLSRVLGMRGHERLIQGYGAREVANGIGILLARDKGPWLWGRVGGDALDLATLAGGFDESNRHRGNVGLALAAVAGVAALDVFCAQQLSAQSAAERNAPRRDYSSRTGFPRGTEAARGAAGRDAIPPDYREPPAMRPPGWEQATAH
jgi:hypothetical protein